jgi:hypothetical protein
VPGCIGTSSAGRYMQHPGRYSYGIWPRHRERLYAPLRSPSIGLHWSAKICTASVSSQLCSPSSPSVKERINGLACSGKVGAAPQDIVSLPCRCFGQKHRLRARLLLSVAFQSSADTSGSASSTGGVPNIAKCNKTGAWKRMAKGRN